MITEYQKIFKEFLRNEIIQTAKEQHLTDEKIAEILKISARSYYYIKSGRNLCSSTTLVLYLANICPDTNNFINRANELLQDEEFTCI